MALSACGGARPVENTKENFYFEEDALAHDEDFSKNESNYISKAFRNLTPVNPTEPLIAVQKSAEYNLEDKEGTFISVRFVAAVPKGQESYSMVWTRAMYDADGKNVVSSGTYSSTHPYTLIHDGSGTLDISDFYGGAYGCFITYTLRKISTDYLNYYLTASLSINSVASTKVVATSVDLNRKAAFDTSEVTKDYFLFGTINGSENPVVLEQEDTTRKQDPEATYFASFAPDLKTGDNFVIVWNDSENNKFKIINPTLDGATSTTNFTNTNGNISVGANNHYALYLKNDNKLQSDIEYIVTFQVTMFSSGLTTAAVVGDFNGWSTTANKLVETATPNIYSVSIRMLAGSHSFKLHDGTKYETKHGNRTFTVSSDGPVSYTFGDFNYYVVGIIQGEDKWEEIDNNYKLTRIGETDVYQLNTNFIATGDENTDKFKVVRVLDNGDWEWFASGGSNYWVTESTGGSGTYTVYVGNDWDGLNAEKYMEFNILGLSGYGGWTPSNSNKLTQIGYHIYKISNIAITADDAFKIKTSIYNDYYNQYDKNYGDNLKIGTAGRYDVTFYLDKNGPSDCYIEYTYVGEITE